MHRFLDIGLQKCRDLGNRVRGPSRSLKMSPCDRAHMTSYWRSIELWLCLVSFLRFNVEKCRDLEMGVKSHSRLLRVVSFERLCMVSFLLVFFSNIVPKMHRFWDIRLVSIQWPWNPGWGSLKIIENYTIQFGTHDFLLTFNRKHRPISHRFRDKRRFPSKIARKKRHFSTPCVFNAPAEGFPLGIGYRRRGQKKLEWWGYQIVEKVLR